MAVKKLLPDLCNTLIKLEPNMEATNKQGNSPLFELFSHSGDKVSSDVTI